MIFLELYDYFLESCNEVGCLESERLCDNARVTLIGLSETTGPFCKCERSWGGSFWQRTLQGTGANWYASCILK